MCHTCNKLQLSVLVAALLGRPLPKRVFPHGRPDEEMEERPLVNLLAAQLDCTLPDEEGGDNDTAAIARLLAPLTTKHLCDLGQFVHYGVDAMEYARDCIETIITRRAAEGDLDALAVVGRMVAADIPQIMHDRRSLN